MTLKVLADPSQLNPVSFWPSTVLLSVWMICNDSTYQISPAPVPTCWQNKYQIWPQTGTRVWMLWPTPVCWLGNLWVRGWSHRDQTQPQISFCSLRTWKGRTGMEYKWKTILNTAQQKLFVLTVSGHSSHYNPSGSPPAQSVWCCTPSPGGNSEGGRWSLRGAWG